MKFFVVGLDVEATTEQRNALTAYLRADAKGAGLWHDVTHTWLIRDGSGKLTAPLLRDKLMQLMPGVSVIVIEAKPTTYSGFSLKSGHEWLDKYVIEP